MRVKLWGMILILLVLLIGGCFSATSGKPQEKPIILVTTTSVQDSGLLDKLVPLFEEETGFRVKTLALGSGQALELAKRGEADVILTHSPEEEKKLVQEGFLINYHPLMYNYFLLLGPPEDPARIKDISSPVQALKKIASSQSLFISRGDRSGTHIKELYLWQRAGIKPKGSWYQETGVGMGQSLTIASEKGAYILSDRGTYLALKSSLNLKAYPCTDSTLQNFYHVAQVNPTRFSRVNASGARELVKFLTGEEAQRIISSFGKEQYGEPLFIPAGN